MPEPLATGCYQPELYGSGRHRPLIVRAPHKDKKMTKIHKALSECSAEHPVFYEDEVDIHLNPKIGADCNFAGSKNGRSLRGRMKYIIWPLRCKEVQVKSVMWAEAKEI